jgi:hypothetical protein
MLELLNSLPAKASRTAPLLRVFAALASLTHGDVRRGELLLSGHRSRCGRADAGRGRTRFRSASVTFHGSRSTPRSWGHFAEAESQLHCSSS